MADKPEGEVEREALVARMAAELVATGLDEKTARQNAEDMALHHDVLEVTK